MENFYLEKAYFTPGKKIGKNDFVPSEKYSCYATARKTFFNGWKMAAKKCEN